MIFSLGYEWQPCRDGARLLKVYGDSPCPVLPASIEGLPVTQIGPYCFAEKRHQTGTLSLPDGMEADSLHCICGNFVEEVTLPDTVTVLDSAAFYNCRSLRRLELGPSCESIGSDVFINCRSLDCIALRCAPSEPSGLKKLIGSISADINAEFVADGQILARLFFPEYFEFLDENTPAHIFNHSIEGEGYRYRQCFDGARLNAAEYDRSFEQACVGETPEKLCRIAMERIRYPYALSPEARNTYLNYLRSHVLTALEPYINVRDLDGLRFACDLGILDDASRTAAAEICGQRGFGAGAALFLSRGKTARRAPKRYSFDDL
nr:leucine-rich repeat protein [uncultured Gemmiger sp.]